MIDELCVQLTLLIADDELSFCQQAREMVASVSGFSLVAEAEKELHQHPQ